MLNTSNIHSDILVNMFINLYDNSNIDCVMKKSKVKYMIYIKTYVLKNYYCE